MNRTIILPWAAGCLALLLGLSCPNAVLAEQSPDLHKQLKDPSPTVRAKAALVLAEANDADAIPFLIDLLAELPTSERQPIEEFLTKLAGEWAPTFPSSSDDRIARKLRRDIWRTWWRDTDEEALLRLVREQALTPEVRRNVKRLLGKLGDEDFRAREAGVKELRQLGRLALPMLREARSSKDPEVVRRVRQLLEAIEQETPVRVPAAAVRLLALRKPQGAVEALLAFYPFVEDDNLGAEIHKALALLAVREDKLNAALVRGLSDELPQLRILAAVSLIKGGGRQGRAAAGKLLGDEAPLVRLRVALAMARARERDSIPVLIGLLAVLDGDTASEAEEVLYQLAGDSIPKMFRVAEKVDRKKRQDGWAAWWKDHAAQIDLRRLSDRPCYGFTLICDCTGNRVFEIDRHGKERWKIQDVEFPVDARILSGNRVLIAEHNGRKITERDFTGRILWSKEGLPGSPVNVQRLPSGNTFLAIPTGVILEVDRAGKTVYRIQLPGCRSACRTPTGDIYAFRDKECLVMNTAGKVSKTFAVNLPVIVNPGCMEVLANGHVLISSFRANKVVELDGNGKLLREIQAPQVTQATALPNGHILAASRITRKVVELDGSGMVVWEYDGAGKAYRARRR